MNNSNHIQWQQPLIKKEDRERLHGHRGVVIWLTGLSGSGKSTIAIALEKALHEAGISTFLLDGDNIRHGLNSDLGFSRKDRTENIRRIGEVAKLFMESGCVVLASFISPYEADRMKVRSLFNSGEFIEVYVKCSLAQCEKRDPKGLYKKARSGEILTFTGISDPYEEPKNPEIIIDTEALPVQEAVRILNEFLTEHGYFTKPG
ncbi:adenylylsulfate kinase [Peribacillus deserti]|uniref:Adenylyl-sulfate kinase n=1 Tax=Peribacillus deserti TaxID=673318 RepID=A0ABS2QIM9_9BACI|nr:adenylyl-sulfate kinase [Peribacillus deserti]MBM7693017.1 adenylylsulfate kinase [Peribacillus deserti]